MKYDFTKIIGKHKNNPCIVVAHGSSLNEQVERFSEYKDNGFVFIGCNDWYNFYDNIPDYVVYANNIETVMRNHVKMNKWNTCIVYADSVDLTDRKWIEDNLKCDYLPYDQRHFEGKKCGCGRCCERIIENRLTIQEDLQRYTGYDKHYGSGDTVTLHMLSLAVLLGCNPIYVTGFDLNYENGYAKAKTNVRIPSLSEINPYMDRIMKDINIINESAKQIGTEIINLNKESKFDEFKVGEIK